MIADFTDSKIVNQEVPHIANNVAIPIVPLLQENEEEPVSLGDLRRGRTFVLDTCRYRSAEDLISSLTDSVVVPAEAKATEIESA